MQIRRATSVDSALLAEMNHELIRDEGHRNRMTIAELTLRMIEFFADGYEAVVIEDAGVPLGYALYKREPDWIYLRQFYIKPEFRRRGYGRTAVNWLRAHSWCNCPRLRLDVLVGNDAGIAFWRSVGFLDYCLTMELQNGS